MRIAVHNFLSVSLLVSLAIASFVCIDAQASDSRGIATPVVATPLDPVSNLANALWCLSPNSKQGIQSDEENEAVSTQPEPVKAEIAKIESVPGKSTRSKSGQEAISLSPEMDLSQPDPSVQIGRKYLPAIARATLALHFGHSNRHYQSLEEFANSFPVPENCQKHAAIFVTFSKNGKTRACWGSINPQYPDLVKGTVYATEAALSKEYRFSRVRPSEWNALKAQVTIIKSIEPIESIQGQNALAYGLLVRSGGKGAILLPGECSDAYYQMIQCKIKAGLDPHKPCQMYRVIADVCK